MIEPGTITERKIPEVTAGCSRESGRPLEKKGIQNIIYNHGQWSSSHNVVTGRAVNIYFTHAFCMNIYIVQHT